MVNSVVTWGVQDVLQWTYLVNHLDKTTANLNFILSLQQLSDTAPFKRNLNTLTFQQAFSN